MRFFGLKLPFALRIAFLALVALNMTLVCQGHVEGNRRVGAHLLVLSEPPFIGQAAADYSAQRAAYQSLAARPAMAKSQAQIARPLVGKGSSSSCTIQPLSAPIETGGATMLGMVFLVVLATGAKATPLAAPPVAAWTPRSPAGPDSPPPRLPLSR